jgi:lipopolysaccharide/colanic/teichoic acid biosynthesis glycosyltransferase
MTIHPYYFSWQKRAFDISFSCLALVILLPFLVMLIPVLFFSSGRPIFFAQWRTGKDKKPFLMWKFRSMEVGAEGKRSRFAKLNQAPWPMFKAYNDPRYTKIGRFMSSTGVDELPQLWNILKGEMSVVGPRPLPVKEAGKLGRDWDFRYKVRPGILSEWAVNPERYRSLSKWKELEKKTLKKGTWEYDLKLVLRTYFYLSKKTP